MQLVFSDLAKEKVVEFLDQTDQEFAGLRLAATKQGRHRFRYDFSLVEASDTYAEDQVVDTGSFKVYVDAQSAQWLEGTTVDFVSDHTGTGFKLDNPQAVVTWDDPLAQKVQDVIDEQILPSLQSHGGWIELLAVEGDTAVIEFGGGCQGCGMSQMTLKNGIESAITSQVPEIKQVQDQTDHASGQNPYA